MCIQEVFPGKKVEARLRARYSSALGAEGGVGALLLVFDCSGSVWWCGDVNSLLLLSPCLLLPCSSPVLFIAKLVVYQPGKQLVLLSRSMCCSN